MVFIVRKRRQEMHSLWSGLFFSASMTALSLQPNVALSQNVGVMLAAVSRNDSMLIGGIGSGRQSVDGTVFVEPLARLTQSGEWGSLPCDPKTGRKSCSEFEREYL